jgi:hypothetical protein
MESRTFASGANYTIYVHCVEAPPDHPEWLDKQWIRLGNAQNLGFRERSAAIAHAIAGDLQAHYGGKWLGIIRDCQHDPMPERRLTPDELEGCRQHILRGPDGPGKRFLQGLGQGSSVSTVGKVLFQPVPALSAPALPTLAHLKQIGQVIDDGPDRDLF